MRNNSVDEKSGGFFAFTTTRPVAIIMVVFGVSIFGAISLLKLPVNLLPEIAYPTITVRTEYPGAAPEDVEERVSRRIHEALSVLPRLEQIASISKSGLSDVTLEFAWGTNIAYATQNIREKLDQIDLPDDVERPVILRYDPTLDPILRIGIFGDYDLSELRKIAEDDVQRRLETIDGVAAVKVRGGLEEEIRVELDARRLRMLDLDISEIDRRLSSENVNMAGGTIKEGDTEYLVRTLNQFKNLKEIENLVLRRDGGNALRMADIARIRRFHKERDVITRINGKESIELQIFKEADANIVTVAEAVKNMFLGTDGQRAYAARFTAGLIPDPEAALREMLARKEKEKDKAGAEGKAGRKKEANVSHGGVEQGKGNIGQEDPELRKLRSAVDVKRRMFSYIAAKLPGSIQARVLSDQSRFIQNSISEVISSILIGGVLAIIVLYLFLRKFLSTGIIALAIPISVVATFAPMYLTNTSLNIMSLGGLALGIGMLVDNSIIVLESIFRCREEGNSVTEAARRGVSEIGGAATASTLTTVAVFFPIAFVEGIAGQIFRDQALTVVFSLLTSLAVALFFIPMLASRRLPEKGKKDESGEFAFRSLDSLNGFLKNAFWTKEITGVFFLTLLPNLLLTIIVLALFPLHFLFEFTGFLSLFLIRYLLLAIGAVLKGLFSAIKIVMWPFTELFDLGFGVLKGIYPPLLRMILVNRPAMAALVAGIGLIIALGVRIGADLGQELLPEVHQGELIAHIAMPPGTPLERTDALMTRAEKLTMETDLAEWVSSSVGVPRDEIAGADEGEHTGKLFMKLKGDGNIREIEERALARLRSIYSSFPEIQSIQFTRPTIFSFKAPLQVEVKGANLDEIASAAKEMEAIMRGVPGLTDVKSTVHKGNPEIIVRLNREKLTRYGLDTFTVADRIANMVKGKVPTLFQSAERKVDILVKLDEDQAASVDDLAALAVNPESQAPLPLSAVADIEVREGPGEIRRIWGQRAAVVSANLTGFDMGGTSELIRDRMAPIRESSSLNMEIGGQGRDMEDALGNMKLALYLAIFLVYVVMASQFESLIQPFIIICTIPLALVGVVLILYALDIPLSVVVFIGVIMLAGIVVNNAIVLIDYINKLRDRGHEKVDAIVTACTIRLRPVLMTTMTTVLGLLPLTGILGIIPVADLLGAIPGLADVPIRLGIGEGTEIRAPMAIAVIAGLLSSTVLTFFVIPLAYYISDGAVTLTRGLFTQRTD
jgi:hydrophobic/amphiphilic exporter-1 (mainly G- bacteria), HAE1 family